MNTKANPSRVEEEIANERVFPQGLQDEQATQSKYVPVASLHVNQEEFRDTMLMIT